MSRGLEAHTEDDQQVEGGGPDDSHLDGTMPELGRPHDQVTHAEGATSSAAC